MGNTYDLWISDLHRGIETRLTSDPGNELGGVWLPGGRTVVFASDRDGRRPPHLFRKDLVTGSVDELLPGAGKFQVPQDVSPDGTTLAFVETTDRRNWGLSVLALTESHTRAPLFPSLFEE